MKNVQDLNLNYNPLAETPIKHGVRIKYLSSAFQYIGLIAVIIATIVRTMESYKISKKRNKEIIKLDIVNVSCNIMALVLLIISCYFMADDKVVIKRGIKITQNMIIIICYVISLVFLIINLSC